MKLGLLGKGISHSLSPFIYRHWLNQYKKPGSYRLYPFEAITKQEILALELDGLNITMPFKKDVVSFLDQKDSLVEKIKAANTLLIDKGVLRGTNTDATGFKRLIEPFLPLKSAVILGAGGVSLSTIWALSESGVKDIRVVAGRNENVCMKDLPVTVWPRLKINELTRSCDIFINATPCGMRGGAEPLALPSLPHYCLVVDWVYHPYKTELLIEAKKNNCQTIDGLQLLLSQAQDSFFFWFGIYPDITTQLRRELCKLLD
jgi:shikimate dehydrogenase